jgi:hypothetical protein
MIAESITATTTIEAPYLERLKKSCGFKRDAFTSYG